MLLVFGALSEHRFAALRFFLENSGGLLQIMTFGWLGWQFVVEDLAQLRVNLQMGPTTGANHFERPCLFARDRHHFHRIHWTGGCQTHLRADEHIPHLSASAKLEVTSSLDHTGFELGEPRPAADSTLLVNLDVSRDRPHFQRQRTISDFSLDVMLAHRALHRHFASRMNAAGDRMRTQEESLLGR